MPETLIVDVICPIEHGLATAVTRGSLIENGRALSATTMAQLETAVVSVQEMRERFGLSDTAIAIIVPAIFTAYGDALRVVAEMQEQAEPDILVETADKIEAALAKIAADPVSWRRLLAYYGGDVERLARLHDLPHDLRASHHPGRKRGRPAHTADLRAFCEPIVAAWRLAGLDFPKTDSTRPEARSVPLGHELIRWLVTRFFGAHRVGEMKTILREI
jgi:hypothetical protein